MTYKIKKDPINKIPKAQLIFWIIVRIAMVVCAGYSFIIDKDVVMGFESVFSFIFTFLWDMFQVFGNGSFIEDVPPLNQTLLNVIIFVGIVIGSYGGVFDNTTWFDNVMHFLAGFVSGVFGYDFAVIVQKKSGKIAPTLAAIFAVTFALSIAVSWEFYEFAMDRLHGTNLQLAKPIENVVYTEFGSGDYGLIDTMTDLIMNAVGGVVGMIYIVIIRVKQSKKQK